MIYVNTLGKIIKRIIINIILTKVYVMENDKVNDRCPICSTMLNPKGRKSLCVHVIYLRKKKGWFLKKSFNPKKDSAQGQKYSLIPAWRKRRSGRYGQIK